MSNEKPFNMMSKPPTVGDLCKHPSYCQNQINIAEAINNSFDSWPDFLGRCQLCIYFRQIDFSGTSTTS